MVYLYEGGEDTDLLIRTAQNLLSTARRPVRILEIGMGPGTVAAALIHHPMVECYVGIDILPEAVTHARRAVPNAHALTADFTRLTPDMLHQRNLPVAYDLILTNPPYLPQPRDADHLDTAAARALIGGEKGYETLHAFLAHARSFTAPGARMIALTSSLSRPHVTQHYVESIGWRVLAKVDEPVGLFERLIVFTLATSSRLEAVRGSALPQPFTRGWHSILSRITTSTGIHVLKEGIIPRIIHEALLLTTLAPHAPRGVRILQPEGVWLPSFLRETSSAWSLPEEGVLILPYVEGIPFTKIPYSLQRTLFPRYLAFMRRMDLLGVIKGEVSRPGRNVLVQKDGTLVILDFERARPYTQREWNRLQTLGRGRNERQALQYARKQGWHDASFLSR